MSQVTSCPTCGGVTKINQKNGVSNYRAVQDGEALKKVSQLKSALQKFKLKAEKLEAELKTLRTI